MGFMKLRFFSSWSSNDSDDKDYKRCSPSPEVHNYTIEQSVQVGRNLVVKIRYNDVMNYEGLKVMVYKDCDIINLELQELIDPHFAQDKTLYSPFARFEPTAEGWNMALRLAQILHKN